MKNNRCSLVFAFALVTLAVNCGSGSDSASSGQESTGSPGGETIVSTSATNDATLATYTLTYTGTPVVARVYIDTDVTLLNGYSTGGIHAKFRLENGLLSSYTGDGTSSSWSAGTPVTFTNSGNIAKWTLPLADFETDKCAENALLVFGIDDIESTKQTENFTLPPGCTTPPPQSALSNFVVTNDDTSIHYQFTYTGSPTFFRVFLDVDKDSTTGALVAPGVGAEYKLEGASLYKNTAAGWGTAIAQVTFASADQIATWTVPRKDISEDKPCGQSWNLLFQIEDTAVHSSNPYDEVFTDAASCGPPPPPSSLIQYVFVIAMENQPANAIYGSSEANYINTVLLPKYARANAFTDPLPDALPSEPHYLWMEAGTNAFDDVTFTTDSDPSKSNSTASTAHLTTQMGAASPAVSWMSYQEGLDAATGSCPINSSGFYAAKHDPFVFFTDVSGSPPSATNVACAAHHQAYDGTTFAAALSANTVAHYNFITPNLCHDMHGAAACPGGDLVAAGDTWLSENLPPIIDFANAQNGVVFLVWDEPEGGSNLIAFLAIGPQVKAGYANNVAYTHGSLVKTVDRIFKLPVLPTVTGDNDFGDLFVAGALP